MDKLTISVVENRAIIKSLKNECMALENKLNLKQAPPTTDALYQQAQFHAFKDTLADLVAKVDGVSEELAMQEVEFRFWSFLKLLLKSRKA